MIGPHAFVMIAEGRLSSTPKTSPAHQLGHDTAATPMTSPIANRSTNAAVIAPRLSGNDIGSILAAANEPKARPATIPYVRCVTRLSVAGVTKWRSGCERFDKMRVAREEREPLQTGLRSTLVTL